MLSYLYKRVFSITFAFISSKSLTSVFVYHFLLSEYRQTFFGTPVFVLCVCVCGGGGGGSLSLLPPPPPPFPTLRLSLSLSLVGIYLCVCGGLD